jgi:hypothetical protein
MRRDPDGILEVYAEGATVINPAGKAITREDLAEAVRRLDPSAITWKVLTRTSSDGRVVEEVEYFSQGHNLGILTSVYTVVNQRIVSERMYANSEVLMNGAYAQVGRVG